MIGHRLLHYEILEKLGAGGMGVVYKAHDTHLDRFVAIKVLSPEKLADPLRKARFVQEAKSASALNHSGIVTVHDIASHDGSDFIVMEYGRNWLIPIKQSSCQTQNRKFKRRYRNGQAMQSLSPPDSLRPATPDQR